MMLQEVVLMIRVSPGARQARWIRMGDGVLKCYLKAPAVDGKANQALVEHITQVLGVARSCVEIFAGKTARTKHLKVVTAYNLAQIEQILLGEEQKRLF